MTTDEKVQFEKWAKALAEVESANDTEAWGDNGYAMGRWQVHVSWFFDWVPESAGMYSWDAAVHAGLEAFYTAMVLEKLLTPVEAAVVFHLGWKARVIQGRDDTDYRDRFMNALVARQEEMK